MVDQRLLTIFIALTSVAILIQTGIFVGLYIVSRKISLQADRAIDQTQKLFGPMDRLIDMLQTASSRLAEFSASTQGRARQVEIDMAKAQSSWRETLDRWKTKTTA
jgi:hypothetical protein